MKPRYILIIGIIGLLLLLLFSYRATAVNNKQFVPDVYPITDSTFYLGTSTRAWLEVTSDSYCLTGDSCITTWPAGGPGGGSTTTIAGLTPGNGVFVFNTSTAGTVFTFTTTSPRTITFTWPANLLSTTTAATTYPTFAYASSTFLTSAITAVSGMSGPSIHVASSSDTNILISISTTTSNTLNFIPGWTGTLEASRLNSNVVQAVTNDTNVTGSISSQNLTLGWTGQLAVSRGGTGTSTLGNLTVSSSNLSITGGQLVLIGTSTQITLTNTPSFTNLTVTATTTLSASTTINGLNYFWPASVTGTKILQNDGSGNLTWVADQTGGGGSVSGGTKGFVTTWASSTGLTTGILRDNGTVAGVNATSSTVTFNVQGGSGLTPFRVASSTGVELLSLTQAGVLTLPGSATTTISGDGNDAVFGAGITAGGDINLSGVAGANILLGDGGGIQYFSGTIIGEDATGTLSIYNGTNTALLDTNTLTGDKTFTFPDTTGTFCLTVTCVPYSYASSTFLTSAITRVSGMTGPSIHVSTSSDTNILLSVNTTTANTLTFVPGWTGVLAVARGGTATSTTAWSNGQLLGWTNSSYGPWTLTAGSNITITTTTAGTITIAASGDTGITAVSGMDGPSIHVSTSSDTNITISVSTTTADTLSFIPGWAGVLSVARGGTATSTAPWSTGQVLAADGTGTNYAPTTLIAGSNITLTTSTPGQITIAAAAGSGCTVPGISGQLLYNSSGNCGATELFYTSSNVGFGINSTTPNATLVVQGTSTQPTLDILRVASSSGATLLQFQSNSSLFVFDRDFKTPTTSPLTNQCGLFWISGVDAFRTGCDESGSWVGSNAGTFSTSFGFGNIASGEGSLAIGERTDATADFAVAMGDRTLASGQAALAMGTLTQATGEGSFAGGINTIATSTSFAFGTGDTKAGGGTAIAMGVEAHAYGQSSVALGGDANYSYAYCSAIGGSGSICNPEHSIVLGGVDNVIQLGASASANSYSAILGGSTNNISGPRSMAIGSNISNTKDGTITIGSGVIAAYPDGTNSNPLVNGQDHYIYLGTNSNLPTMVIASSTGAGTIGRVAIGTTTPTAFFHLQGSNPGGNTTTPLITISSSTGSTMFQVAANGSTTIPSLTFGVVYATANGDLFVDNLPGGTHCLDEVGGIIGVTGSGDCATLGGNNNFTGLNSFAATTTMATTTITRLGIATTTPQVSLVVVGSTTMTSLNAANCDVKSTVAGALYCGTDANNGGVAQWTIGAGTLYNATSTDLVGIGTSAPTTTLYVQGKGGTNPFTIASSTGISIVQVLYDSKIGVNTTTPVAMFSIAGHSTYPTTAIFDVASSSAVSYLQVTAAGQILACTTCRLTIPQGTGPTLSAVGDIAVDTSNGGILVFHGGGAAETLYATGTKAMLIESPTASESLTMAVFDVPITITKVTCQITSSVSNTPSWTFSLPHNTSRASAAANVFSSGQACTSTTTPQTFTSFSDATLAANEVLWATSSAVSNASTTFIQIHFKYDR